MAQRLERISYLVLMNVYRADTIDVSVAFIRVRYTLVSKNKMY